MGLESFGFVCLKWVLSGVAPFETVDHDTKLFEIKVSDLQESYFTSAEAMSVGNKKECLVSFAFDHKEEAFYFVFGQKFDGFGAGPVHVCELLKITFLSNSVALGPCVYKAILGITGQANLTVMSNIGIVEWGIKLP